jgi:glucosamine-6-phosphate deaminase
MTKTTSPKKYYKPKIVTLASSDEVADHAAGLFASAIVEQPKIVLGLATGGSPVATYRRLVDQHRTRKIDFARVVTFNLDEYIGLENHHPQSFRYFMQRQLFDHVNISLANTHVPDGMAEDADEYAKTFERTIASAGGIDLQLLGIGTNGHIAFNEPGAAGDSRTRAVGLTTETIQANSRFFDSIEDVPTAAITMGIGTILESKRIVLLATGEGKADALVAAIRGPVTTVCPASFLRMHPDVTIVIDKAAASKF